MPAQPWVTYSRRASTSISAQVFPLALGVPSQTPKTWSVGTVGVKLVAHCGPAAEVPVPPLRRNFAARNGVRPSALSCSGKAFGSAAAANASAANRAACWWLPWLPGVGDGFIVMMISGRVVRMTRTIWPRVSSCPQICSDSGADAVYQKSTRSRL